MYALLNDRQQQIMAMLIAEGEVKTASLKEIFDVTEMTLRRDMEKLEQLGFLRRIFGGAIYTDRDVTLRERVGVMKEEKMRIGKRAAEMILPGESVFIDAGTTTEQIAHYLKPNAGNTVVTNALNVAGELHNKGISTIVTGGSLLETTNSLIGPMAEEALSKMAFDRVFIGATGVTGKHGLSNSNMQEAAIKRIAMKQADEINVVLDHSKFGAKVLISFAQLNQIDRLITDRMPEEDLLQECLANNVEIMIS